jgi:hypothetical protein
VISSTVSPRTLSAIRKPPICAGVALPDIIASNASSACCSVSGVAAAAMPSSRFKSSSAALMRWP